MTSKSINNSQQIVNAKTDKTSNVASAIKEKVKNLDSTQNSHMSTDNCQNEIQVIPLDVALSPGEIHAIAKERIKKTSTIRNGESNDPITYQYDATAYELPVNIPYSVDEIRKRSKLKLKKSNKNSNVSKKMDKKSMHTQKVSSIENTHLPSQNGTASNRLSNHQSANKKREPSPEIEIIEEVLAAKPSVQPARKPAPLHSTVNSKCLVNTTSGSPPAKKPRLSQATSSRSIPIVNSSSPELTLPEHVFRPRPSENLIPDLQVANTTPSSTSKFSSRSLLTETGSHPAAGNCIFPSETQASTSAANNIIQGGSTTFQIAGVPKPTGGPLVDLSSRASKPHSDFNSSWTPQRLSAATQKPSTSRGTSIKRGTTSPARGVKRFLQNNVNNSETGSNSTDTVQQEVSEDSVPKYEYLRAFKLLLTEVWKCEQNMPLFDSDDIQTFSLFFALSEEAKALYVQLFKMKHQWRRISTIKYDDIRLDLLPVIKELVVQDFLEDTDTLVDLRTMLDLLKVPELKTVMQQFKLPVTGRKQAMIDAVLNHGCAQRSIFPNASSSGTKSNLISVIKERVKALLGPCVRLQPDSADSLHRVCLLGSLPSCLTDDNLSQLVLRIYRTINNHILFPTFQMQRARQIFRDKNCLVKFQQAHKMLLEVNKYTLEKNWDSIIQIANEAWIMFREIRNNNDMREHDTGLPHFLRRFTAGDVLASVLKVGLEAMNRRKQYANIVELLRDLLGQQIYKMRHRGFWYERLALTLHSHLKDSDQAAEVVMEAMADQEVHLISKVGIANRACQLLARKAWKPQADVKQTLVSHSVSPVCEPPAITIRARSRQGQGQGLRLDYIHEGTDGDNVIISSVEELAISHYKRVEDFTEGVHAEGSTVISLFGILFWDIIYECYVPDVFLTKYQDRPLDLSASEFYVHREMVIEKRLEELEHWSEEEAQIFLQGMWEQHFGKMSLVNWRVFRDIKQAQGLLLSMGTKIMSGISRRLCRDYRVARSGFPDLVVWTPGQAKCKFVEVKSSTDHLSSNQRVWIDYLIKIGAKAEVCHVQTVSAKYLQANIQGEG